MSLSSLQCTTPTDSDDYVPRINFTVTFQPSETLIQIPIAIRNDDTLEGIERFFAVLTAMDPSVVEIVNGTASISIIDDDRTYTHGQYMYM